MPQIRLTIRQSYERLEDSLAPLSRDGRRKIHKWSIFADSSDCFDVATVKYSMHSTFRPQDFEKTYPPFRTTHTSYGFFTVNISVVTRDGQRHALGEFPIRAQEHAKGFDVQVSRKRKLLADISHISFTNPIPPRAFGLELELIHSHLDTEEIADHIRRQAQVNIQVGQDGSYTKWCLVSDRSVQCMPGEFAFEIVSPVLHGKRGLEQMRLVAHSLCDFGVRVNKSAGFHVHINAEHRGLGFAKHVAQSFVKYEEVLDELQPPSRQENVYCKSNSDLLVGRLSNKHEEIDAQQSLQDLVSLVSPDRYMKMNLQNLLTRGNKTTIEFRQHSATFCAKKIEAWVRLLLRFVDQAEHTPSGRVFKNETSIDEKFDRFFEWVIKDSELQEFYIHRRRHLRSSVASSSSSIVRLSSDFCGGRCCAYPYQ